MPWGFPLDAMLERSASSYTSQRAGQDWQLIFTAEKLQAGNFAIENIAT
jgi:hypothetical protein